MKKSTIEELRKILVEELSKLPNGKVVKLPCNNGVLRCLLFPDDNFSPSLFSPSLKEVLNKINFSNVSFDEFLVTGSDFSGLSGFLYSDIAPSMYKSKT